MTERPRQLSRTEIEAAIARLRNALAQAEPGSVAADTFRAAIQRHERQLAEIDSGEERQ